MSDKPEAETKHANPYTLSPSEVGGRLGAKHVALQEAMGAARGPAPVPMGTMFDQMAGDAVVVAEMRRESMRDAQRQAALGGIFEPVATPVTQRLKFRGLHTTPGRVFTREEVLTVLRAQKAMVTATANPLEVLAHLILAFERME